MPRPLIIALTSLLILAACSGTPGPKVDPPPLDDPPTTSPTSEGASENRDPPETRWTSTAPPELGLAFELPPGWKSQEGDGMTISNPPPPDDDVVVLFMKVKDGEDGLPDALKKLDGAFPMKDVRYKERNQDMELGGLATTYGEGIGFSPDFETDLHFFIMSISAPTHTVVMAAYIKEARFEAHKPTVLRIIQSIHAP